jgi:hypothetical protein
VRRRAFLSALLGLLAWLLAPARRLGATPAPLLPAAARERLAGFAAVIVPAWNGQPAAGTGEFLERFEALARLTPRRVEDYGRYFERFVREVDAQLPPQQPQDVVALDALFERWHEEWRREAEPSFAAQFFELLRRDVLRSYYSSPAGWRSLAFHGPAHRATPDGK